MTISTLPFSHSNFSHIDVGFPSVCYEYVLFLFVSKEAALTYGRAEYSQAGRDIYRESRQSQRDVT